MLENLCAYASILMINGPDVTDYHNLIILSMKKLGYLSNESGICHGYALMGMQALLLREMKNFDEHLQFLESIDIDELSPKIEAAKQKSAFFVQQAVKSGIRVRDINLKDIEAQLTKDESKLLDILPLFDGIELYFHAVKYKHLFEKNTKITSQDPLIPAPLVMPTILKEKGGIAQALHFTGMYNEEELTSYFQSLKDAFSKADPKFDQPISLLLSSSNHTINVGFDGENWILIDANKIPTQYLGSDQQIAQSVLDSLSKNENACFSTKVFVTGDNKEAVLPILDAWKMDERYKQIHALSSEKTQRSDSYDANWLEVAAAEADMEVIREFRSQNLVDSNQFVQRRTHMPLLTRAVIHNHLDLVKEFLDLGVDPNIPLQDDSDPTPLAFASQLGHIEVMNALIADPRVDPNQHDREGKTILIRAIESKDSAVVNALIENKKVDPNKPDPSGHTPLYYAAKMGNADFIRLLLSKAGMNTSEVYPNGLTLIDVVYLAMNKNDDHIIKDILAHPNVLPAIPQEYDKNSVFLEAMQSGHANVIKKFIPKEFDVNQPINGVTALYKAVYSESLEAIKFWLDKGADPNILNYGRSALHFAVQEGKIELVEELLANGHTDPNVVNNYNESALHIAANSGNLKMVQILLAHPKIDPNLKNNSLSTPLAIAALNGDLEMVKAMLANKKVDPTIPIWSGKTPIELAAEVGHLDVVYALLSDDRVNKMLPLDVKYTLAASVGDQSMVEILLTNELLDPNVSGEDGKSALYLALAGNYVETASTILQDKRLDPKKILPANNLDVGVANSLMILAIKSGRDDVIAALLEDKRIDPNKTIDQYGSTLLHLASKLNQAPIVKLLVDNPRVNINQPNLDNETALFTAVNKQSLGAIQLLVESKNLDPNVQERVLSAGWTALHCAVYRDETDTVKMLLNRNDIDLSLKDDGGETVLDIALSKKNSEMISLIQGYQVKQQQSLQAQKVVPINSENVTPPPPLVQSVKHKLKENVAMMKMVDDIEKVAKKIRKDNKGNSTVSSIVVEAIVHHLSKQSFPISFSKAVADTYAEFSKAGKGKEFVDGFTQQNKAWVTLEKKHASHLKLGDVLDIVATAITENPRRAAPIATQHALVHAEKAKLIADKSIASSSETVKPKKR